jgi:hypothetical protein
MREGIQYLAALILVASLCMGRVANSDDGSRQCDKLEQQVTGPAVKYSMTADVNGFAAFDDIGCSIEWRNRELCATELASFDITARVFDFLTGSELEMAKAYFVVSETAPADTKIIAFASKQDAEKYVAAHSTGKVVDFTALTELKFD